MKWAKGFSAPATLAVAVLMLAAAGSLDAAENDPLAEGGERHLNGHGFMPSIYVNDPFVSTQFQNHTGGGMASEKSATFYDADGNELFTFEGNLFFAALGLGFQQKLGTKWAVGAAIFHMASISRHFAS